MNTSNISVNVIQTGSRGNAVLIGDKVLIDCGVAYKKVKPYLGSIQLILLTHFHADHFKEGTIKKVHDEHPMIRFGCCSWMVLPLINAGVAYRNIDVLECGMEYTYDDGAIRIRPEPLEHNVRNCGYHMTFYQHGTTERGYRIFYATDCATLDGVSAEGYDMYCVEANHKRAELEARLQEKLEAGEYAYEFQAAKNHLSEEQALDFIARSAGANSQYIFLHQHTERSNSNVE